MAEGVSGLFHGMDFFDCGFPSRDTPDCGDLKVYHTTTGAHQDYNRGRSCAVFTSPPPPCSAIYP
jgi:hypothetical protein